MFFVFGTDGPVNTFFDPSDGGRKLKLNQVPSAAVSHRSAGFRPQETWPGSLVVLHGPATVVCIGQEKTLRTYLAKEELFYMICCFHPLDIGMSGLEVGSSLKRH